MADREDSDLEEVVPRQQEQTSAGDVVLHKQLGVDGEVAADGVAKRVKPVCHLVFGPTVDVVKLTCL